jgi:exonuclease III
LPAENLKPLMKLLKTLFALFLCFTLQIGFADTIRMMQYNLMYYTTSAPSGCNTSGNYMDEKDENLKTIINYTLPDVFCVNEIGSQNTWIDRLLNNVLNSNGRTYYARCPLTNFSGGTIANMLYYDSRKLAFHSYFYVTTSVRDINAYKMYYKSAGLAQGDTAFITFIIAHLKAGNTDTDRNTRKTQVERLTTKLEQIGIDNYVFSGDFNLYTASEPAYQHLLFNNNTAFRFLDPIDAYGNWHRNQQFAKIHTQSTHTISENGCFATGGMDDRFDFILASPTVSYGTRKVKVLPETYYALGQDGLRFRQNLLSPANHTLPTEILQAMYNFSDHLPVICDFEIKTPVKIETCIPSFFVNVENPVKNELSIRLFVKNDELLNFEIFTIEGKRIDMFSERITTGNYSLSRRFDFAPSLYILKITNERQETIVKKLIK